MHRLAKTSQRHQAASDFVDNSVRVITETTAPAPNAIKADGLSVFAGKLCLLSDTQLKIAEHSDLVDTSSCDKAKFVRSGQCYGLVGPNGCGKSTILKLMAGGHLPLPDSWDMVIVNQELPEANSLNPVEEVLSAHARRCSVLSEMDFLEQKLSTLAVGDDEGCRQIVQQYEKAQEELSEWDGEDQTIERILVGLGFHRASEQPNLKTPMCELSGGWRMKVQLAKALWLQPKLLLLDEPSNHLDFQALLWLEERLLVYPNTVVVVSHDVTFLKDSCDEILWINEKKIEAMPTDRVSQEDLARMQRRRCLDFKFAAAPDASAHGMSFHRVAFQYGLAETDKKPLLLVPGDVRLTGSSRSLLLGKNGSGKSTFLQLCAGLLQPNEGTVDCTHKCQLGYFSQLNDIFREDSDESAAAVVVRTCHDVLSAKLGSACLVDRTVQSNKRKLFEHARAALTKFGIEGDAAVNVPANRLSGGQKSCVKFAALSLKPAHILLLDEPTNHLDAEARTALASGLVAFEGGVVIVTHDDELIYRLIECNKLDAELLLCQNGTVRKRREFDSCQLKTLKEQLRRAEATEAKAAAEAASSHTRSAATRILKEKRRTGQPFVPPEPIPDGFSRVGQQTGEQLKIEKKKIASRKAREKPRCSTNMKSVKVEVVFLEKVCAIPEDFVETDVPSSCEEMLQCVEESAVCTCEEVLQRVEETATRTDDVPESWLDRVEVGNVPESWLERVDVGDSFLCDGFDNSGQVTANGKTTNSSSGHSRLRKKLTNVPKWQKRVRAGTMTEAELEVRVLSSLAAIELQVSHGNEFVSKTLQRM